MKEDIIEIETGNHTCETFYWRGGNGIPIVLLQGGMVNAEFHWKSVWAELEKFMM